VPRRRITIFESQRGDGALLGSFCGVSGHQKWVETTKPRRIHGTRGDIRVSSAQPSVGAVGSDSIWEIPVEMNRSDVLYWIAIGAIVAYLSLFLFTTRPVSLRCGRLGWILLAFPAARGVMLLTGSTPQLWSEASWAMVVIVIVLTRKWSTRVWIVRTTATDVRERIETACRGLFLKIEEPADGRYRLTVGEQSVDLRLMTIGKRFQCVLLPSAGAHGKLSLLVDWLAKQYPGPVPPVRIVLKVR
jgi:hypothetical protein